MEECLCEVKNASKQNLGTLVFIVNGPFSFIVITNL